MNWPLSQLRVNTSTVRPNRLLIANPRLLGRFATGQVVRPEAPAMRDCLSRQVWVPRSVSAGQVQSRMVSAG
jgi:hypothetical protein